MTVSKDPASRAEALHDAREVPAPEAVRSLSLRVGDYLTLSKIRVNLLVLFVVAVGFFLGSEAVVDFPVLLACLLGTALLGSGASALNQYIERDTDLRMARTEGRPLPRKNLRPFQALAFGLTCGILGVLILALGNGALTSILGATTFLSYTLVYTPLKRRSPHALFVGAVPGALPPLIGWAAATDALSAGAWAIFAILFIWQIPHFLAIAWLYREDYEAGGIPTFAGLDREGGRSTGQLMLFTTTLLVLVSLSPLISPDQGSVYCIGVLLLGILAIVPVQSFVNEVRRGGDGNRAASWVVRASIIYLPLVFLLLVIDKIV